ncbi:hypothetical protein [Sulfuricella sp.]|nr:hypothetical protein [Sulfuricella sp.]HUX63538.1 hypothetical protein [Sulfuricella sp.]
MTKSTIRAGEAFAQDATLTAACRIAYRTRTIHVSYQLPEKATD